MNRTATKLLKAGLAALHYSRAGAALSTVAPVQGAILTLHQVSPDPLPDFAPNRILRVTPDFLDATIRHVLEAGFDIVTLDEAAARIAEGREGREGRRFVCFTLDDGYRDNLLHAYPVFRRFGVPFTVYIPTDYPDGRGDLWWLALEEALRGLDRLAVTMRGRERIFEFSDDAAREAAFHEIYWWLRGQDERLARALVRGWCLCAGVDSAALCRSQIMSWPEIRTLAADPLVTIGAHTTSHFSVAKLSADEARMEIEASRARIAIETGKPCRHFSFPYGDCSAAGPRDFAIARSVGLTTAVTTAKGFIHVKEDADPMALPRLSLNGDFQDLRYLKVLLTGTPFTILAAARRMRGAAA